MFEKALFESTHRTAPRGRLFVLLGAAFLVHFALLVVLTAAQAWAVEAVAEPTILVGCDLGGYVGAPDPLPPPPATAGRRGTTPPVQPPAVPAGTPTPSEDDTSTSDGTGVPHSLDIGQRKDARVVIVEATPTPAPTPEPEEPARVLEVGGEVSAPVLLDRVDPAYPAAARAARIEGQVRVQAVVEPDGRVSSAEVIDDGLGFGAAGAVRDAVLAWRYQPARWRGRAVPVRVVITVSFRLT